MNAFIDYQNNKLFKEKKKIILKKVGFLLNKRF